MPSSSADDIKWLRAQTQAPFSACASALKAGGGDRNTALKRLRSEGAAKAAAKRSRVTREGSVAAYVHTGEKIGVLVELNCETDFVARTAEFQQCCRDLCLQVAATNPTYLHRDQVPPTALQGLTIPAEEYYKHACLLEQPFIKDEGLSIADYVAGVIAKTGENITVRRFIRFELGEELPVVATTPR